MILFTIEMLAYSNLANHCKSEDRILLFFYILICLGQSDLFYHITTYFVGRYSIIVSYIVGIGAKRNESKSA